MADTPKLTKAQNFALSQISAMAQAGMPIRWKGNGFLYAIERELNAATIRSLLAKGLIRMAPTSVAVGGASGCFEIFQLVPTPEADARFGLTELESLKRDTRRLLDALEAVTKSPLRELLEKGGMTGMEYVTHSQRNSEARHLYEDLNQKWGGKL